MKKVRLIIAVVTIALMVMGVGYAAWGQDLPVRVSGSLYEFNPQLFDIRFPGTGNTAGTISTDKRSGSIITPKLYPGASQRYLVYVQNNGDMSAKLTNVKFTAIAGERASIVRIQCGLNEYSSINAALYNGNTYIPINYTLQPGEMKIVEVTVSVPESTKTFAYGDDDSFSFTLTPTFEQVNP